MSMMRGRTKDTPPLRMGPFDEEKGKKDDYWRPWQAQPKKQTPLRWRRRRLFIFVLVAIGVYLFIHNIPTDLGSIDGRVGRSLRPGHVVGGLDFGRAADAQENVFRSSPQPPTGPPPKPDSKGASPSRIRSGEEPGEEEHYYSGPIKFYKLKASLDAISALGGHRMVNRNVLFAVSRLRSASNLFPLACAMAKDSKSFVHLVLLGREAMPVEDLLKLNGINQKTCEVWIHDGRADYSEYSSNVRAEASVVGAMNHVNSWMHPQVVITDDEQVEDAFFIRGMRGKMKDLERPIIELPAGKYDDFMWMTRLDSTGLSSWHKPRIEIVVHDPPHAGGGLTRLLKSLSDADMAGFKPPKLTVELPARTDDFLQKFLQEYRWPNGADDTQRLPDLLKLQRRIPATSLDMEAASVRFLEAFYPANSADEHILVLSPDAEVSPLFYHYIMFVLLSTRYSALSSEHERLAGLALAPETLAVHGKKFTPPKMTSLPDKLTSTFGRGSSPPYLYQTPQASSLLIFGDRWAEFHDYLTRRLHSLHANPMTAKPHRLFAQHQPAWLEFLLELVRARSWAFIYPPSSKDGVWATIHTELYRPAEESLPRKPEADSESDEKPKSEEPFLIADQSTSKQGPEQQLPRRRQSLHDLLPFSGPLPDLSTLPLLSYTAEPLKSFAEAEDVAVHYVKALRQQLGGCTAEEAAKPKLLVPGKTGDLFCYQGREAEEWELNKIDMRMFSPSYVKDKSDVAAPEQQARKVREQDARVNPDEEDSKARVAKPQDQDVRAARPVPVAGSDIDAANAGQKKLAHQATDLDPDAKI